MGLDGILLETSSLQAPALSLVISVLLAYVPPLNDLKR